MPESERRARAEAMLGRYAGVPRIVQSMRLAGRVLREQGRQP
jgi:hypothetical protein